MTLHQHTARVGLTAILCAFVFRLFAVGIPENLLSPGNRTNAAAFLVYLETGQDVRFSSSSGVFSPQFVETPPPAIPLGEEPELPSFSDPEAVSLYYASPASADIGALLAEPLAWNLYGEEPTVLILHTHSTESYTKNGETYRETAAWRTLDENHNMLSVGDHLARLLQEAGIGVLQDREVHDYPSYNGSYLHARKTVQALLEKYPTVQLVLDLHRDASAGETGQLRTLASVEGERCAQLMVVLGTNHEEYERNLSLGLKIHAQLEARTPGITRPLQLRAQRFNQDLSPGMLLIEVGAAGNTRAEALLAAEALAEAVIALGRGTK